MSIYRERLKKRFGNNWFKRKEIREHFHIKDSKGKRYYMYSNALKNAVLSGEAEVQKRKGQQHLFRFKPVTTKKGQELTIKTKDFSTRVSKKSVIELIPHIKHSNMQQEVKVKLSKWIIERYLE